MGEIKERAKEVLEGSYNFALVVMDEWTKEIKEGMVQKLKKFGG